MIARRPNSRHRLWARRALRLPVRRPILTLLIAAVCAAAAGVSVQRLRPEASMESMFPRGEPSARALSRVMRDFRATDELLLLVRAPPEAEDGSGRGAADRLTAFADRLQRQLNRDARAVPLIRSVRYRRPPALQDFAQEVMVPAAGYYLDEEAARELAPKLSRQRIREQIQRNRALAAAPSASPRLKRVIRDDPLRLRTFLSEVFERRLGSAVAGRGPDGAFLSADGRHLLIRIRGERPSGELEFTRELVRVVRRAVSEAAPGGLSVAYGGGYAATAYSAGRTRSDLIRSTVGSVLLVSLLFVLVYRTLWSLPLALIPLGVGLLIGFGLYGVFSASLSPLAAAAGGILAGLGIDYCIHGLAVAGPPGGGARPMPQRIGAELSGAMTAACVSSIIGFGAIATSPIPALQQFGLLGMLGLAGTLVSALCVLPALLAVLRRRMRGRSSVVPLRFDPGVLVGRIASRPRACAAGMVLILSAGGLWLVLVGSKELRWEHDLRDLEPRPNPPAQTQEQVSRLFAGGRAPLTLLVEAGSPRALVLAAHRARNNLLASGADGVFGLGALLPDPARVEARRRRLRKIDAQRVIRDFRSALKRNGFKAEAYRDSMQFLRRLLRPGEPPGLDALRSYPDLAASILERDAFAAGGSLKRAISMVFVGGGAQGSESAVAQRLRASVAGVGGATLTGMPIVGADMQRMVRRELLRLMGLAAIAVGLWLLLCFRRPGPVLLMVLPTVGAFLTVGVVAGLGAVRLNPITLVIVPLVAGLGVDDGVFLVRAAVRAPRGRLIGRLRVASIAITTTSLTTGLAFASLLLTSIPAIRAMGLAMAAGIAGAWAVALFLLVPVLVVVRLGR